LTAGSRVELLLELVAPLVDVAALLGQAVRAILELGIVRLVAATRFQLVTFLTGWNLALDQLAFDARLTGAVDHGHENRRQHDEQSEDKHVRGDIDQRGPGLDDARRDAGDRRQGPRGHSLYLLRD